jgi:hypothetical protein
MFAPRRNIVLCAVSFCTAGLRPARLPLSWYSFRAKPKFKSADPGIHGISTENYGETPHKYGQDCQ